MSAVMQRNPTRARALDWLSEQPLYLDIPMNLHRASADAELTRRLVQYIAGGQSS